ncbi:MAG: hypothetical protein AAFV19_11990 [Pseudomonadota bacterium]
MASLDRAYGVRGMVIALGMASVAGGVHGVLSWSVDSVVIKFIFGCAAAIVMIMAGAISARKTLPVAIALGVGMGVVFFLTRWVGWSVMEGGVSLATVFLTTAPWGWPAFLEAHEISRFWIFEFTSVMVPAIFGTIVGQERTA